MLTHDNASALQAQLLKASDDILSVLEDLKPKINNTHSNVTFPVNLQSHDSAPVLQNTNPILPFSSQLTPIQPTIIKDIPAETGSMSVLEDKTESHMVHLPMLGDDPISVHEDTQLMQVHKPVVGHVASRNVVEDSKSIHSATGYDDALILTPIKPTVTAGVSLLFILFVLLMACFRVLSTKESIVATYSSQSMVCTPYSVVKDAFMLIAHSNLCEFAPNVLLVVALGHLQHTQHEFAGMVLARSFNNGCFMVVAGLSGALCMSLHQAQLPNHPNLQGLGFQRACFVLFVACSVLTLLSFASHILLQALEQDVALSNAAQPFMVRLSLRLWIEGLYTIFQQVGQSAGLVTEMVALTAVGCGLAPLFVWVFVYLLGWGYVGCVWAAISWHSSNFVLLTILLVGTKTGRKMMATPLHPISEVLSPEGAKGFLVSAIPPTVETFVGRISTDFLITFAAGSLPNPDLNLGATVMVQLVFDLVWFLWGGLQGAMTVHVGRHISSEDIVGAKRAVRTVLFTGSIIAITVAIVLHTQSHVIACILTSDLEMARKVIRVMGVFPILVILEAFHSMFSGVLRAVGCQTVAVMFQFIGLLGMLATMPLLLHNFREFDLGLECLWASLGCSTFVSTALSAFSVLSIDWNSLVVEAQLHHLPELRDYFDRT